MSSSSNKKANRLIESTSPYLLQHAYNPVDWHEWNPETLEKAVKEDKPILLSIGYSSCHWCHVMERESFENDHLASLMNQSFVCIKVDREERPDVDQVYMEAVQAMGINGGWPLNVFLTPDQKPFYGGTYFPPSAWQQLLENIREAWQSRKSEIFDSAASLTDIISKSDLEKFKSGTSEDNLTNVLDVMYEKLQSKFDLRWGGFNKAPKFIMPSIWHWLLRYYHLTGNHDALAHINLTLTKIKDGGIYDQVGGGFSRYSVDSEWFAPHFEKMLYDNAQLMSLYSEAYLITQNPDYKQAVYETFDWLQREMTHYEGGFFSALDADSEGVEGKYYTWKKEEIQEALKQDADLFCKYYGVTDSGNWEHGKNILKRTYSDESFLHEAGITAEEWSTIQSRCKNKLLKVREKRIRPALDDKILTGWNAMMTIGLVDAYNAFDEPSFLNAAKRNIQFLEQHVMENDTLYRSYKNKRSGNEAFLEDYAYLIKAYIKFYQTDFEETWLKKANDLVNYVIANFFDPEEGLFYFTSARADKLIARKKELFDNVIPSSNSLMAMNLFELGIMLDKPEWKSMAQRMVKNFHSLIQSEPEYMSNWGIGLIAQLASYAEVAMVGKDIVQLRTGFNKYFLPFALFMGTESQSAYPLLKDKVLLNDLTTIYVCRDYSCREPVHEVEKALAHILNK